MHSCIYYIYTNIPNLILTSTGARMDKHTHMLPRQTDYGNTLDENKAFGVFFSVKY